MVHNGKETGRINNKEGLVRITTGHTSDSNDQITDTKEEEGPRIGVTIENKDSANRINRHIFDQQVSMGHTKRLTTNQHIRPKIKHEHRQVILHGEQG